MKELLIVDDDLVTLAKVSTFLGKSGYKTFTADNGQTAFDILQKENISLIIVDVLMPIMGGIDFLKKVRAEKKYYPLPIIMLTAMSDISDKYIGFDAGADDYLTKPFEVLELLLRVQALLKRAAFFSESESKNFYQNNKTSPIVINEDNYSVTIRDKEIYLTAVEFDILCYLYSNKEKVISSEDVLQKVLNYPPRTGNPESIRTHIKNIRAKIEQDTSKPQIITTVPKRGYVFNNIS